MTMDIIVIYCDLLLFIYESYFVTQLKSLFVCVFILVYIT